MLSSPETVGTTDATREITACLHDRDSKIRQADPHVRRTYPATAAQVSV